MTELTCIVCPRGCLLRINGSEGKYEVSGNFCKRGEKFAVSEMTEPMRTVCTTVRTAFDDVPVLPVRVSAEIPKNMIFDVMKAVNSVKLEKRVSRGDVIIENVLGTGADIISTGDMKDY